MRHLLPCLVAATALAAQTSKLPTVTVPGDPRELVTGAVQVPSTPPERADALALLERAKQNADLHMPGTPPFRLKLNFTAGGNVAYTGSGEISEAWTSGRSWRYEQNLGSYSQVRIGSQGLTYDDKLISSVPLRVQMLRAAFFWPVRGNTSAAMIRTATAEWNGKPVTCSLFSRNTDPVNPPGRHWEETEYCVDNASGLLQIYSEAPGSFVLYGYSRDVQFHGRHMPDQLAGYVNGALVLEAQLVSLEDATGADPALFTPTHAMIPAGPPNIMAMRFPMLAPSPTGTDIIKPVIVHAFIGADGHVTEQEVSAAGDDALAQEALDLVKKTDFGPGQLRHVYVNVRFAPRATTIGQTGL